MTKYTFWYKYNFRTSEKLSKISEVSSQKRIFSPDCDQSWWYVVKHVSSSALPMLFYAVCYERPKTECKHARLGRLCAKLLADDPTVKLISYSHKTFEMQQKQGKEIISPRVAYNICVSYWPQIYTAWRNILNRCRLKN